MISPVLQRLLLNALLAGCLVVDAARSAGEVAITSVPSPLTVAAASYESSVESDGCLTSLKIAGREFLAPGVAVSRGAYFFRGGTLKLPTIERPDATTIASSGNGARAEYRFQDDRVTCRVANESQEPTAFFIVLSKDAATTFEADGRAVAAPVERRCEQAVFAIGEARLELRGIDRLWGPWQGPHQVCEVLLKPGDSREVVLLAGRLSPTERRAASALLKSPAATPLAVFSPQEYQVFQRDSLQEGDCVVDGSATLEAERVEYRISGQSAFGDVDKSWRPARYDRRTGGFSACMKTPAGGWYALEFRALRGDVVVAETKVKHFGVGEVFLGAGQSNSTNCGETPTKQTSGMVASFGGERWKLADDPQLGVADNSTGGSFWPAFGDAMYARYRVPIGVAATGFGGTSVNQWQPDGGLFAGTITRARQTGPGRFRALLWHQGESDVDMPSGEYLAKLRRVILSSRHSAGWQIPWFVAQATYHNMQRPATDSIRMAQERLWTEGVALRGPDTDVLQEEYRDLGGKGIHFNPVGLHRHGQIWAERVAPWLDGQLGLDAAPDPLEPPVSHAWPEADLLFHRDPQWLGSDDAYSIDLGGGRVAWFFGDSFVEPQTPGERRGTTMVRNSVGLQTGYDPTTAEFKAYWSHDGWRPTSYVPDDGEVFSWPGGGAVSDGKLLLFLMKARNAKAFLNFENVGWGAVLLERLDRTPDQWKITKLDAPQNEWEALLGSGGVVCEGEFVYAFSHRANGIQLVRWDRRSAFAGDLSNPRWYDSRSRQWTDQGDLAEPPPPIFSPGQTEFTVHRLKQSNQYVQVQFLGFHQTAMMYRTAPELTGPWSELQPLYAPEELFLGDPEVMLYAGKLHPEQVADGLALTYASNAFQLSRVVDDDSLYYPRFARVKFPSGTRRGR